MLLVGPFAERLSLAESRRRRLRVRAFLTTLSTRPTSSSIKGDRARPARPCALAVRWSIVPYGHDQPDNAMRVSKLGISETIGRQQYTADAGRDRAEAAHRQRRRAGTGGPDRRHRLAARTARPRPPTPSNASSATGPACADLRSEPLPHGYHPGMRSARLLLVVAIGVLLPAATYVHGQQHLTYPPTEKGTVVDDYFGTKVPDPYRWMEDLDSKAVADWVKAENTVTVRVSRQAAAARRSEEAHHRDVELPEGQHAVHRRRTNLLSQELRAAEAVAALRPHDRSTHRRLS